MPRSRYGKPDFKREDFAAFLLFAGRPPNAKQAPQILRADQIQNRLDWMLNCSAFKVDYFDAHYPYARWIDFYREYLTWIEFHKNVRQEKENERQKSN